MKKAFFGLVAVLALGLVQASSAAVFLPGPSASLSGPVVNSNVYGGGGTVTIGSDVNGDAYLGGGTVMVNNKVSGDLGVAGGNVFVYGEVGDDLRAVGGSVFVNSKVNGETMIGAGQVNLSPGSVLAKGAYIGGGTLTLAGTVNGDVKISGEKVELLGVINGNVDARASELTVGPNAVITGSLKYKSPKETVVPGTAKVGGVQYTKIESSKEKVGQKKNDFRAAVGAVVFFKMLLSLAFVLVLYFVFKRGVGVVVLGSVEKFWTKVLTGFVVLVVAPIAMIFAAITVVGLPFAGLAFGVYAIVSCLSSAFSGALLGSVVFYFFKKKESRKYEVTWVSIVVGILLLAVLRLIPVVGWLACLALFLAVFGQMWTLLYEGVKRIR